MIGLVVSHTSHGRFKVHPWFPVSAMAVRLAEQMLNGKVKFYYGDSNPDPELPSAKERGIYPMLSSEDMFLDASIGFLYLNP